jgi:hypothetical protein
MLYRDQTTWQVILFHEKQVLHLLCRTRQARTANSDNLSKTEERLGNTYLIPLIQFPGDPTSVNRTVTVILARNTAMTLPQSLAPGTLHHSRQLEYANPPHLREEQQDRIRTRNLAESP